MNLSPVLKQRFFDANGLPLAGGQLFSYQAGTSTPQVTYSNASGTTNTNPVVLDSSGYADVWIDPNLSYKFILEDSLNNVLWTVDGVSFPFGVAAWNANSIYAQGSVVQDSSGQGMLYVSLINNNQNNALTSVSSWRVFAGNLRTVSVNTNLAITDDLVRSNSTSGNLTHTLPACSTTPIGKKITIKDIGTGGNSTSVVGSGSDNIDGSNTYSSTLSQYISASFINNGTSWDSVGTNVIPDGSVTQVKLAPRVTGTTVVAGGVATSAPSGDFASSSSTLVDVDNLSVTITTTGRPVMLQLVGDFSAGSTAVGATTLSSGTASQANVAFVRGSTILSLQPISVTVSGISPTIFIPVSAFSHLDQGVVAGTYTYKIQADGQNSAITFQGTVLVAWEI